jgi:transcriptional regulator with XRE-family HTH domain
MNFGERLKELRLKRNMTLRDLADKVNVNFTYLSKIENNKLEYTPSIDTIRAMARALDVEEIELLKIADKVPAELTTLAGNANAMTFLRRAKNITSPDDWKDLLDFLDQKHDERSKKKRGKG